MFAPVYNIKEKTFYWTLKIVIKVANCERKKKAKAHNSRQNLKRISYCIPKSNVQPWQNKNKKDSIHALNAIGDVACYRPATACLRSGRL